MLNYDNNKHNRITINGYINTYNIEQNAIEDPNAMEIHDLINNKILSENLRNKHEKTIDQSLESVRYSLTEDNMIISNSLFSKRHKILDEEDEATYEHSKNSDSTDNIGNKANLSARNINNRKSGDKNLNNSYNNHDPKNTNSHAQQISENQITTNKNTTESNKLRKSNIKKYLLDFLTHLIHKHILNNQHVPHFYFKLLLIQIYLRELNNPTKSWYMLSIFNETIHKFDIQQRFFIFSMFQELHEKLLYIDRYSDHTQAKFRSVINFEMNNVEFFKLIQSSTNFLSFNY